LQFSAYRSQVAPVNGTMGYGVPAAVACKLVHPERTADFAPALERALEAGRPALLELRIDPDAISPRTTLSAIRAAARD
jgi:thiamine pyrophosphate-dependent acetolactate synthase large subunit-like protein